jgi:hypothetical protein
MKLDRAAPVRPIAVFEESDGELERAATILAGHVVRICLAEWKGDPLQLSRLLRGQAEAMQRASQKLARASIVALTKGRRRAS